MCRQHWRVVCWIAIGATTFLTAGYPLRAVEPRTAFQDELVVYDPGTHERGLAGIELQETENGTEVDVSRALHVHRTYYTGDKEFQFKLIQGGPSTIVANHPRSGEKLYIDVDLPSGIPIISYNQHSITYVFPDRRVCIQFPRLSLKPKVTVVNLKGHGPIRTALERHQNATARHRAQCANSPLVGAIRDAGTSTKNIVVGTVGFAGQTGATVINRTRSAVENLPLISHARQAAENRAEEGSRVAINRITKVAEKADRQFFPTNR